eukprot:TRINITY_DN1672_c0_g1_i10.p1 TRINITY_DN1672_c0_g1~~TRINITY_DN1672_c0_g1_i10.p1  ORF type:complete len:178 (+),score=28.60 TRINITY_DN1672_c0_g1_i10:94-627(+)
MPSPSFQESHITLSVLEQDQAGGYFSPSIQRGQGCVCGLVCGPPSPTKYCQVAGLEEARAVMKYEDRKFKKYQLWFRDAGDVAELAPVTLETFGSYGRAVKVLEDIRRSTKNTGVLADSWSTCYSDYSVILATHIVRSILGKAVQLCHHFGSEEENSSGNPDDSEGEEELSKEEQGS